MYMGTLVTFHLSLGDREIPHRGQRRLLVLGSSLLVRRCDIFGCVGMKAGGPVANETGGGSGNGGFNYCPRLV